MATAKEREMILAVCAGGRTNKSGFVREHCPVCITRIGKEDRDCSLGYRPKTGGFRCFRCGVNGRMQGEGYVLPEVADAEDGDAPPVLIPYDDFFPLWTDNGWSAMSLEDARTYMLNRGFTREHMAQADVHVAIRGRYEGRIIIPHKDEHENWWGFTSRTYAPWLTFEGAPKVLYPKNMDRSRLYNEQILWAATDVPAMVVEGCLDSLWYLPLCCASLGKPTEAHFEKLVSASRPIVFCLDGDAWESGRALMMRLKLRGKRAGFVRLPAGEDPNSIDPDWLRGEVEQLAAAWRDQACTNSNPSLSSPPSSASHASSTSTASAD